MLLLPLMGRRWLCWAGLALTLWRLKWPLLRALLRGRQMLLLMTLLWRELPVLLLLLVPRLRGLELLLLVSGSCGRVVVAWLMWSGR